MVKLLKWNDYRNETQFILEQTQDAVHSPKGFPNRLWEVDTLLGTRYVLANTRKAAVNMVGDGVAKPVLVTALLKKLGHQGTHHYLKYFAPEWITKGGMIF